MQKLEGVVIRMQQNFNNITFLFSNNQKLENIQKTTKNSYFKILN
jgi:hypothetical protein